MSSLTQTHHDKMFLYHFFPKLKVGTTTHFYRCLKKNSKPQRQNFYLKFARSRFLFHIAECLHACNIVVKWYMLLSTLLDEIFLTSLTTFWLRQNVGKKILFDWSFTIKSFVFLLLHLTFFRMAYVQSTIDRDTFYNMTLKKHRNISLLSFKKLISISSFTCSTTYQFYP